MSTLIDEFFTTGPDGTTLAGTSQGSPNCTFTTVVGTPVFEADVPAALVAGSGFAMRVAPTAASWYGRKDFTAIAQGCERIYFYLPTGLPSADTFIENLMASSTIRGQIRLNAAGTLSVRNGTSVPAGGTTTNSALAANTLYRLERLFDNAATTQRLVLYLGHSLTPISGGDTGNVTYNQGTVDNTRVGAPAAATIDIIISAYRLDDTAVLIGPASVNAAPDAEVATGTAAAGDATVQTTVNAGSGDGTGAALFDPTGGGVDLELISDNPVTVTGAAFDATVTTTGQALAEATTGLGEAYDSSIALLLGAEVAAGEGGAFDAVIQVEEGALYRFTGPTRTVVERPFAEPGASWGPRVERVVGLTVLRVGGVWRAASSTTAAEEAAADRLFHGGHIHTVDQITHDELAAAGYGAYLTPIAD